MKAVRSSGVAGWEVTVREVTMPKLGPAPRIAQKRSGWEVGETVVISPLARTTRRERMLSTPKPTSPMRLPRWSVNVEWSGVTWLTVTST